MTDKPVDIGREALQPKIDGLRLLGYEETADAIATLRDALDSTDNDYKMAVEELGKAVATIARQQHELRVTSDTLNRKVKALTNAQRAIEIYEGAISSLPGISDAQLEYIRTYTT